MKKDTEDFYDFVLRLVVEKVDFFESTFSTTRYSRYLQQELTSPNPYW